MLRDRLQLWLIRRVLDFKDEQQLRIFRKTRWRPLRRRVLVALIWLGGVVAIVAIWGIAIISSYNSTSAAAMSIKLILMCASALAWSMCVRYSTLRHALPKQVRRLSFEVCLSCGYNLKGNSSGRCPECGEPYEHAKL